MSLTSRLAAFVICLATFTAQPSAQEKKPEQGGAQNAPVKKANARPSTPAASATEPFDGASVEKMAAQCVTLDTEAGVVEIEMLPESAPESVRNFLNLVAADFFDTTTFSRVVKDFVVQGGNISTRESGLTLELVQRARRTVPDEPNEVKHVRGIVSMARGEEPNSASTHFFILVGDAPHLDRKFAAFGRVVRGMEAVDQINRAPVEGEKPLKPVRIKTANVAPCAATNAAPQAKDSAEGKPKS